MISEENKLYIIQSNSLRSIWIKEETESKELQSDLIWISSLIESGLANQTIQLKEANLSSSILSILINNHQIIQFDLLLNKSIELSTTTISEHINTISSSSSDLIFSSNSKCFQYHSNSNSSIELDNNLGHHHSTIQHLIISSDSTIIISSSIHHGVMVLDQINQSNHKLNIKSKSPIRSISISSFSSRLFTINLESKILLFDLNLHLTKSITAFKLNSSNSILINAHFSNLNSNLLVFLNQFGQIGLGDLTHHKLISQTQLQLSKNEIIKLSSFSPNGKTLICLTSDGNLISKDLKSSNQITLLRLSPNETQSTLKLLFQFDSNPMIHNDTNKALARSKPSTRFIQPESHQKTKNHSIKQDHHSSSSSSSSSISTLISPKLKPISSQPKSKKEFESGIKSEARVSTLISKVDEPFEDDENRERLVTVSVDQLERIIDECVNRSIEKHQEMMMKKFEELKLDVLRQGYSTRKEINESFNRVLSYSTSSSSSNLNFSSTTTNSMIPTTTTSSSSNTH